MVIVALNSGYCSKNYEKICSHDVMRSEGQQFKKQKDNTPWVVTNVSHTKVPSKTETPQVIARLQKSHFIMCWCQFTEQFHPPRNRTSTKQTGRFR